MEKQTNFSRGYALYEKPDQVIPFQLKNIDKIDKVADINRITLLNNITRSNATVFYKVFDSLNNRLMEELEREYRIK